MRDLLWVLYLPARQCVSSMNMHNLRVSVFYFRLLIWKRSPFILSGIWLQRLDLNPLSYKVCIEIKQRLLRVCLGKIHYVNVPTLWYEQRITNSATDELFKRFWVCVRVKRTTFLVFWLTADSMFVHFNVLVWWELQASWCYCVEYIRISPFVFLTFHKVMWLHS